MIYGYKFVGTPIPSAIKRKFAERIKLPEMGRGEYAYLEGVAQSEEEKNDMLVQATNGRRGLHVERRETAADVWFGIYSY